MPKHPLAVLAFVSAFAIAGAEEKPIPKEVLTPAGQIQIVANDLATGLANGTILPEDAPFLKYFSTFTLATAPEKIQKEFRQDFRYVLNKTNGSRKPVPETEVPGSFGTLFRIKITDAVNWTRAAWEIVGNRDYIFREPNIPHRETEFIRRATGVKQDPTSLAAVSVLNAYQLFREIIETDRQDATGLKSTYYDLLYAAERHPDGDLVIQAIPRVEDVGPEPQRPKEVPWPGGVWPLDGKEYPAGAFQYTKKSEFEAWEKAHAAWKARVQNAANSVDLVPNKNAGKKGIPNFPETGADFERRWGAEVNADQLKNFLIDPRIGGIGRGANSDETAGSYVAAHDRVIRIFNSPFGWAGRTFDVFENVQDRDHIANFANVPKGKIAFDAGELLASMPNGAQAALLVDGQDKRVEIANTKAARNTDPKIDKFPDVRTMTSCTACHAKHSGFIPFREAINDAIKKGLEVKRFDDETARKISDFYDEFETKIRGYQEPYQRYVLATTATKDEPKGWTPERAAKAHQDARDWFDKPVGRAVAARELGLEPNRLTEILLDLEGGKIRPNIRESVRTRINQLALDQPIPRLTWQKDTYFELALLLDALKAREEPIKLSVKDELIQEAIKQLEKSKR